MLAEILPGTFVDASEVRSIYTDDVSNDVTVRAALEVKYVISCTSQKSAVSIARKLAAKVNNARRNRRTWP